MAVGIALLGVAVSVNAWDGGAVSVTVSGEVPTALSVGTTGENTSLSW